jgi:hypothetical protein
VLDMVTSAITALQAETTSYPDAVQVWMKVMGVSFLCSLVFVRSRAGARWILFALVLNLTGLVIGKMVFPDLSRTIIGTYVHILFWPAILWAVWISARQLSFSRQQNRTFDWIYIIWLCWASLLMSISLIFDVRTLVSLWFG